MPGLRYFSSLNNIIFGDTAYGYLISCTFIPLLIYLIFEKLINKKIAIILFSSFIFLPIFENMGFGFFNYIWQFAPGSQLIAFYRNSIFNEDTNSNLNFFKNLDNLFEQSQKHTFSLRFVYFID